MYYTLLDVFKGKQADIDHTTFIVQQLLGNVPRQYLGIHATSKGMLAGKIMTGVLDIIEFIPVPESL